ncbi:MAG: hypothetical protein KIT76_18240, partial [Pseudolabrys sp.]|nr:hypothetical protein [Pseudolabrys sp.]
GGGIAAQRIFLSFFMMKAVCHPITSDAGILFRRTTHCNKRLSHIPAFSKTAGFKRFKSI